MTIEERYGRKKGEFKEFVEKQESQIGRCGKTKIATINTFAPEPYDVLKPIVISISSTEDGWSAAWHDANIHSSGENEDEAVSSLKSLVLDFLDAYSKEPREKLGPGPLGQLETIGQFVRKSA